MGLEQIKGDEDGQRRRKAICDLLAWIDSEETARALDAIDLLELSDRDIETLCLGDRKIARIPFLGKVS